MKKFTNHEISKTDYFFERVLLFSFSIGNLPSSAKIVEVPKILGKLPNGGFASDLVSHDVDCDGDLVYADEGSIKILIIDPAIPH